MDCAAAEIETETLASAALGALAEDEAEGVEMSDVADELLTGVMLTISRIPNGVSVQDVASRMPFEFFNFSFVFHGFK